MIHFLLACWLAISQTIALSPPPPSCDACINNLCHQRRVVLEGFEQIGQLAIDRTSNIFYFYIKDNNKPNTTYTIAYDLDNVNLHRILFSDFSFARAVDPTTRDVYISRETDVFMTNPDSNFTVASLVFDASVWHMQFKDKLYYSEFNSNGIKYIENDEHKVVQGLSNYKVDDFIIDKNNDIYFVSDFTVYKLKHGEKEAKLFADDIYTLTTDKNGEAYLIQPYNKGIYKVDYSTDQMVLVGAFEKGIPFRVVFTSDNYMIYSDTRIDFMYLLVPGTLRCLVSENKGDKTAAKTISYTSSKR